MSDAAPASLPRPVVPGSAVAAPTARRPATAFVERDGVTTVHKTLAVLETVAERDGATAREVADVLGFSLPTVYRMLQELVRSDYLVHLKGVRRFELGYKLHTLGVSLHRQIPVPAPVREAVAALHERARAAAYFAVYRGADVVVAVVSDCPEHPRLTPLKFGFHEAAHATAFGKIMLAGMSAEQRGEYLHGHGLPPLTTATIVRSGELERHLEDVATRGVAWEREEFVSGMTCAAIAVHNAAGLVVGSVAISGSSPELARRESDVEHVLREYSGQVSRYYRSGSTQVA